MSALNDSVLILNKHYTAIDITSAQRALCMLFIGAAEAIDVENDKFYSHNFSSWKDLSEFRAEFEAHENRWVRCVSMRLAIPAIIRVLGYGEYRRREAKISRKNIFLRDNNACQYCGKKFKPSELSVDHVVPKSRGGCLSWDNIVCACVKCNTKKANRTPKEAGMKLIRTPVAPKHLNKFNAPRQAYRSWKHFVDTAYWNCALED